jgi:RNA polymerase sigma factor (sigma-70 family)
MTASGRDLLRQLLLLNYDGLKTQLARRLGSVEDASDALQDTWLRLEGGGRIGDVRQLQPYLLRIAYNIALRRRQRDRASVTLDDARAALDLVDDAPDPERIAEAKSELAAIDDVLAELSPRQRDILLASRVEAIPLSEIAARHGLSQRMVEIELKFALMHCGWRLGRKIVQRFGPRSPKESHKRDAQ